MSKIRVGEIRPSQFMYTYGIGSIIDLPAFSVIVNGLDHWNINPDTVNRIFEDRLLDAVRYHESHVKGLISPPLRPDDFNYSDPFDESSTSGLPVSIFPRWMVCPMCHLLAPVDSGLFDLKKDFYRVDKNRYVHTGCTNKGNSRIAPQVVPARFLAVCEEGHIDDFPWVEFIHEDQPCNAPRLEFHEYGVSGEARGVFVRCTNCGKDRRLSEAFQKEKRESLPLCKGYRPHLRDTEECDYHIRPLVLGASNSWFPVSLNVVAIPVESNQLNQVVEELWEHLIDVEEQSDLSYLKRKGLLSNELTEYTDDEIMQVIQSKRDDSNTRSIPEKKPDLKRPEWDVFTGKSKTQNSKDFRLKHTEVPETMQRHIKKVVLVERLREVSALIGFTRLDSWGEFVDPDLEIEIPRVPLFKNKGDYMPANEVRGEGIFFEFDERALSVWEAKREVQIREFEFFESHKAWREAHGIENADDNFPGIRYVLLHSFAHALMRQLALECGYPTSSIRERIYSATNDPKGPMAGILIYTAAPDSEGTLGGLVEMGKTQNFAMIMQRLFEDQSLCANDPTCAENIPNNTGQTIHGAACHACLFSPETSCERGNKYLDRSLICTTIERDDINYF